MSKTSTRGMRVKLKFNGNDVRLVRGVITFNSSQFAAQRIDFYMNKEREELVNEMNKNIYYSDKYYDEEYEYRHVVLPRELVKLVPKNHLMSEQEWRSIGVQQSRGWIHYMTHSPEPHILLFKRLITSPPPQQ